MATQITLKDLNRKAYLAFHRDGIIDILVGIACLGFGLWLQLDIVVFAFLSWVGFSFYNELKNRITVPRFGYASFEQDKKQFMIFMSVALVLIILLLGARLFLLAPDRPPLGITSVLRKFHPYIMGTLGALLMVFFGWWRGIKRFVGYGVFFLGCLLISLVMELPGQIPLLVVGGVILLGGIYLLLQFLRKNPVLSPEVTDAE